jgi:hypothetical protein
MSDRDVVIRVEGVSKLYRLGEVGTGSLAHDVNRWWHRVRGKEDPYLKIGEVNDRTKPAKQAVAGSGSRVTGEEGPGAVAGSELLVTSENQSAASLTRNSPPVTRHSADRRFRTRHQLHATRYSLGRRSPRPSGRRFEEVLPIAEEIPLVWSLRYRWRIASGAEAPASSG